MEKVNRKISALILFAIIFCLTNLYMVYNFKITTTRLSDNLVLSADLRFDTNFYSDPVLLEVVNSEYTAHKSEIELIAEEIETESKRPVTNVNYILGSQDILPTEDSEKRGKVVLGKKEGIPTIFLNRRAILRGRPGPDNPDERKTYIKDYIKEKIRKTIHKEYFLTQSYNIKKINSSTYQLNLELKAKEKVENNLLQNTKIIIFLVANEIKSAISPSLTHKNVAYRFISIKGFENVEFDGSGIPLSKITNKTSINKEDILEIESTTFSIDENIKPTWSLALIIENNKKKYVLYSQKFKLSET